MSLPPVLKDLILDYLCDPEDCRETFKTVLKVFNDRGWPSEAIYLEAAGYYIPPGSRFGDYRFWHRDQIV